MSPRVDLPSQLHLRAVQTPGPRLGAPLEGARSPAPGRPERPWPPDWSCPPGGQLGLGSWGGTATPHGDSPPLRPAHIACLMPDTSVGGCRVTGRPSLADARWAHSPSCPLLTSTWPPAAAGPGRAPSSSVQLAGTPLVGREEHTRSPVKT